MCVCICTHIYIHIHIIFFYLLIQVMCADKEVTPPDHEASLFATMGTCGNLDKQEEISVEVTGRDPPQHIHTFEECGFS